MGDAAGDAPTDDEQLRDVGLPCFVVARPGRSQLLGFPLSPLQASGEFEADASKGESVAGLLVPTDGWVSSKDSKPRSAGSTMALMISVRAVRQGQPLKACCLGYFIQCSPSSLSPVRTPWASATSPSSAGAPTVGVLSRSCCGSYLLSSLAARSR